MQQPTTEVVMAFPDRIQNEQLESRSLTVLLLKMFVDIPTYYLLVMRVELQTGLHICSPYYMNVWPTKILYI